MERKKRKGASNTDKMKKTISKSKKRNKKSITPVVAEALLIVVAVLAVIGFSKWFSSYESSTLANTELGSNAKFGTINIETILPPYLYILNKNSFSVNLSGFEINDKKCNSTYLLKPGINKLNISNCLENSSSESNIVDVVIILKDGILEKKIFISENISQNNINNINSKLYRSCLEILQDNPGAKSGYYNISPTLNKSLSFKVYCDMTTNGGGWTVFKNTNTYVNTTNTIVDILNTTEYKHFILVKNISTEINITSDYKITFWEDTPGGCDGTPTIPEGEMYAETLDYNNLKNNTVKVRNFYGSSDHEDAEFNSTGNFFYRGNPDASVNCGIVTRFGVGDKVILKELKLYTQDSLRAYSKISGTYYKIMLR